MGTDVMNRRFAEPAQPRNGSARKDGPEYRVVIGLTSGELSGVDTFSFHMARALGSRGFDARLLFTRPSTRRTNPIPLPADLRFDRLPVRLHHRWNERWSTLGRYLAELSPCVYIPNYDYAYSGVSPVLPDSVAVVGIAHSDDPDHYEHVARLGASWNGIVAVSDAVSAAIAKQTPRLVPRMRTIPYGIPCPEAFPERVSRPGAPLRIVYAGRIVQHQKRVLDVAAIARHLALQGVPFELRIAGNGADRTNLERALGDLVGRGQASLLGTLSNDDILLELERADAFVLASEFEGLPLALLEAMSRGCVPVVSDIRSGIPELVADGENGFRVRVGDVRTFAARLEVLQSDPVRRAAMGAAAHRTVADRFNLDGMVDAYTALFDQVWHDLSTGSFRRPPGTVRSPLGLPPPWLDHLPPVRSLLSGHARRYFGRLGFRRRSSSGPPS